MVKIKGFTLIELMIVVAIIGIFASLVIGPTHEAMRNESSLGEGAATDETTTIINGIPHICDEFGECEVAD